MRLILLGRRTSRRLRAGEVRHRTVPSALRPYRLTQPFFDADFILHTLTVFEVRKPL
jgi:hypothetical protein